MNRTPVSDELSTLLSNAAEGDKPAFEALYQQTSPLLFGVVHRMLGDPDRAADALRDAYVTMWQNAAAFNPLDDNALTWMTGIVRFGALAILRDEFPDGVPDSPAVGDGSQTEPTGLTIDEPMDGTDGTGDMGSMDMDMTMASEMDMTIASELDMTLANADSYAEAIEGAGLSEDALEDATIPDLMMANAPELAVSLDRLDYRQRVIVVRAYSEGLSLEQLSDQYHMSVADTETSVRGALAAIGECIDELR